MPVPTVVKTPMPRRIIAGLLAGGTLGRAIISSKHILNNAASAPVLFNRTTDDGGVRFVWHCIASFLHTASLCSPQRWRKSTSIHLLFVPVRMPTENVSPLIKKVEQSKCFVWCKPGGMRAEQIRPQEYRTILLHLNVPERS